MSDSIHRDELIDFIEAELDSGSGAADDLGVTEIRNNGDLLLRFYDGSAYRIKVEEI